MLHTMFFSLNMDCDTDFLYLYDGEPPNRKKVGQYCGYFIPPVHKSKNSVIHLNFVSGRVPRDVGFKLYFQQVDPTGINERMRLLFKIMNYIFFTFMLCVIRSFTVKYQNLELLHNFYFKNK